MGKDKEHIRQYDLNNLQMRIDLWKESNEKLTNDLETKDIKIKHLVRENVLMKDVLEQIVMSPETPSNIKKVCNDTLSNVEKYKKTT